MMDEKDFLNKFEIKSQEESSNAKHIKYLFSPSLAMAGVKSTHLFKKQPQGCQDCKSPLSRINSKDKISRDEMGWNYQDEFIPHEVILNDSEYFDSSSTSSEKSFLLEEQTWKLEEKKEKIMESNWARYALDIELWKDENAPVIKLKSASKPDPENDTEILTEEMVETNSSFLTRLPENGLFILSKCEIRNMNLIDVSILRNHHYLQYLDLAHNYISDLAPLGEIPYLIYLNAAYNKLRKILDFNPPWYLTEVNLSHNNISEVNDISGFWSIVRLDLSHNFIETIDGLQNLKHLKYLNLAYNLIGCVENLDKLNIEELNLDFNCITTFKASDSEGGIQSLLNLRILILSHNRITTLEFFKGVYSLRYIDLRFNKIMDLMEVSHLKSSVYEVDLRGNPCTTWPNYKDVLLTSMPTAMYIDGSEVSTAERVSATTSLAPSIDLSSAQTITKLFLLEQLNLPKVDEGVTPYDEATPPLIILCGPSAVKKVALSLLLVEKVSERVRFCRSHTTRESPENEDDRKAHIFVKREEFNEMARRGEFLSIQDLLGHSYGFHVSEIAKISAERKIGISQMDLHATIQIYNRYPNTKVVLVFTRDEKTHREWIEEKFNVFTWLKDSVEDLLAVKIGKRQTIFSCESVTGKRNFISNIIHGAIDKLELPPYNPCINPKKVKVKVVDIILKSKTEQPKFVKLKVDESREKKDVTFQGNSSDEENDKDFNTRAGEGKLKRGGLRVILDEKSNIMIDDKETKKRRHRAKVLFERSIMEIKGTDTFEEESEDSLTTEESSLDTPHKKMEAQDLKEVYVKSVMKSRELYINQHQNNPGFFSLVLLSDNFKKSFDSLFDFLYVVYVNQPNVKPLHLSEIDNLKHTIIPAKIKLIAAELRKNLSTSNSQGKNILKMNGKD